MMEVWKGGQSHMLVIFLVNKKELTTKLEFSCFLSASDHDLITFIMWKERIVYTIITHTECFLRANFRKLKMIISQISEDKKNNK